MIHLWASIHIIACKSQCRTLREVVPHLDKIIGYIEWNTPLRVPSYHEYICSGFICQLSLWNISGRPRKNYPYPMSIWISWRNLVRRVIDFPFRIFGILENALVWVRANLRWRGHHDWKHLWCQISCVGNNTQITCEIPRGKTFYNPCTVLRWGYTLCGYLVSCPILDVGTW